MAAGPCRAIQLIAPDRTVRLHYFSSHLPNTNPADARARAGPANDRADFRRAIKMRLIFHTKKPNTHTHSVRDWHLSQRRSRDHLNLHTFGRAHGRSINNVPPPPLLGGRPLQQRDCD